MGSFVLSAVPGASAVGLAQRLSVQPGVLSVSVDPARGQVMVRHRIDATSRRVVTRSVETYGPARDQNSAGRVSASERATRLISLWARLGRPLVTMLPSLLA